MKGIRELNQPQTRHHAALEWVRTTAQELEPEAIHWCDGSAAEQVALTAAAVESGVLLPLNAEKLPGCYLHRSDPDDVARVEERTFICTRTRADAGPNNHWMAPDEMERKLRDLVRGGMRGRTLYVVPFLMGPPGAALTRVGLELTDSLYVVLSMRVMTRIGQVAWDELGATGSFTRGLHARLRLDPAERYIAHFPEANAIISTSSNYGGNVLLGKKCLALRLGSYFGHAEGWMAEHMLILAVEAPSGEKTYVAAAFPSACGKTNFAMLVPPSALGDWKVTTIGDDIAWMWPGADGRLWAINPEAGYFGVVPGTNAQTNRNAREMIARDTIFTNVALLPDGDVWWEGKDGPPPAQCLDWRGRPWTPASPTPAAHPNSRFATPMHRNPALAPEAESPAGVPISALLFGGRRAHTLPLLLQAFDWNHGVFLGATMASETTAAQSGAVGQVRRDPMAMLPFCGYAMDDYFRHWLQMGKRLARPPAIFQVNWFRKDAVGRFLWPGFGENMRLLQWIAQRVRGQAGARETALGLMPEAGAIDLAGLPADAPSQLAAALAIDPAAWQRELSNATTQLFDLYPNLPPELLEQRELLRARLATAAAPAL